MKRTNGIRLTESQLHRVIKKLVKKVLKKTSRRQKAIQAIKGNTKNIKTCAILTAANPLTGTNHLPKDYNDRLCERLKVYLRTGNFAWFPVKGCYGESEPSFVVYNISLDDALHVGEKFEQEGVIWIDNRGDDIKYQYWERDGHGAFSKISEKDSYSDMTDADDVFTQIGRRFKFQIPFFDDADNIEENVVSKHNIIIENSIRCNMKRFSINEKYVSDAIHSMINNAKSGRRLWELRGHLYGGFKNCIL